MEKAEIELRTAFLFAGKDLSLDQQEEIVTELQRRVRRQESTRELVNGPAPKLEVEDGRRTLAVA